MLTRLPFFYGWVIGGVTFVTMAIGVHARTAVSLVFAPVITEVGWGRGVCAGACSFGFLVSAAVSPLIGRMMDRTGPRIVMEIGVALMAAGLLLAPLTTQPWHLYLTIGVLVGSGSICLGYSGQSLFLPNWFNRRRGLAMGLAFAGVGIGSEKLLTVAGDEIQQNRLADRLHRNGRPGSGRARADQPVAAQAAGGYRTSAGWRRRAFGIIR